MGANNSGKTSAMHALICFLDKNKQKNFTTNDFTLSNWNEINKIGKEWISSSEEKMPELNRPLWEPFLPTIDVWLNVDDNEIHYVRNIIPTLDWDGGILGVRLVFEPEKFEELYIDFKSSYENSQNLINEETKKEDPFFSLWPENLKDFLDRNFKNYFTVKSYILDPKEYTINIFQKLIDEPQNLGPDPFKGLIKIDSIEAQRGFSDPNSEEDFLKKEKLSTQFKDYYIAHLDPATEPNLKDIAALKAIKDANKKFDVTLESCFKPALDELKGLNYPGFSDPQIQILSKDKNSETLDHNPCVKFSLNQDEDCLKNNIFHYQRIIMVWDIKISSI